MDREHSYSVVIPSFERYEECLRAVVSVMNQTIQPREVVIVDDGNVDPRYRWFGLKFDLRVTVLHQPENSRKLRNADYAVGTARNVGINHVLNGPDVPRWMAFLDDDDEWMPTKMERCIAAAKLEPRCAIVATNAINRDKHLNLLGNHHPVQGEWIADGVHDVTGILHHSNAIINSTAMINTSYARLLHGQRPIGFGEDFDYWQRASIMGAALVIDEPLAYYAVGNTKHYRY